MTSVYFPVSSGQGRRHWSSCRPHCQQPLIPDLPGDSRAWNCSAGRGQQRHSGKAPWFLWSVADPHESCVFSTEVLLQSFDEWQELRALLQSVLRPHEGGAVRDQGDCLSEHQWIISSEEPGREGRSQQGTRWQQEEMWVSLGLNQCWCNYIGAGGRIRLETCSL